MQDPEAKSTMAGPCPTIFKSEQLRFESEGKDRGGKRHATLTVNGATIPVTVRSSERSSWWAPIDCPPHRNVLGLLGVVLSKDRVDFVMEREGRSLYEFLQYQSQAAELRSSPTRVARLLRDILAALTHLHKHNFVHRDVAARNVFLSFRDSSTQEAKLADWGMMRDVSQTSGRYPYKEGELESFAVMVCFCLRVFFTETLSSHLKRSCLDE